MMGPGFVLLASLVAAALVAGASACSGGDSAMSSPSPTTTCPNDIPQSCPANAPGYAKDVAPVIQASCTAICHSPTGLNPDKEFMTYDELYAQRSSVLTQINSCRMPPADAGALSDEGRAVLLAWLVCGSKNN